MPIYRMTEIAGQAYLGESTTWYTRQLSASGGAAFLQAWANARANTMFTNDYFVGWRVSVYGDLRKSVLLRPGTAYFPGVENALNLPAYGTFPLDISLDNPTLFRNALQYRVEFGTNQRTRRYLAPIPRIIVGTDPATLLLKAPTRWTGYWKALEGFLISNGVQVNALVRPPAPVPPETVGGDAIQAIVAASAGPDIIGIQIASPTIGTYRVGKRCHLYGTRPAKGTRACSLNGRWVITSVNTTLTPGSAIVYLAHTEGVDPKAYQITPYSYLWGEQYGLQGVTDIISEQVVPHKRGKPAGTPRGRRLIRCRLDP